MLLIYNLLLITIPLICLPCLLGLLGYVSLTPKYRGRLRRRLGVGLGDTVAGLSTGRPRIWLHALSVGEVSSARSLVKGLRQKYPEAVLVFSASTRSGEAFAASALQNEVDLFIPFPLDFFWTTEKFVRIINPDLFVLVETDLWPNFLGSIRRHGVRSILVNGRISGESFRNYLKLKFFFSPLFNTFDFLSLQTVEELNKMVKLGIGEEKILALGNLKYDGLVGSGEGTPAGKIAEELKSARAGRLVLVAGSTHTGEEEILLAAFCRLREKYPDLYLVIAPRNIDRGGAIATMAQDLGLETRRRSRGDGLTGEMLVLDTLGELAAFYNFCDVAFVGGSLVEERGHNPLEPAAVGRPVIFGPHMEDFAEIAGDLVSCGGAVCITSADEIVETAGRWFADQEEASDSGRKGAELVQSQQGVTERHLELIGGIIDQGDLR